jgi:peptide/nickel transport system ATP-binding protein
MNSQDIILDVKGLKKYFPLKSGGLFGKVQGYIKAVDDVTFYVKRGETIGVVGESGCGKTTLGRCISLLYEPTAGDVKVYLDDGVLDVEHMNKEETKKFRRNVQMIFQDPYASLNPRMTVLNIVGESLLVNDVAKGDEMEQMVGQIVQKVGLKVEHLRRYPHSFSGGQRQRIGIARALVINPQLVVYMSDRIMVMYAGKLVEMAPREVLLNHPRHPYTELLLSAVPRVSRRGSFRLVTPGEPPDLLNLPQGCVFNPRCKYAKEVCKEVAPSLVQVGPDHFVRCHMADELTLTGI